MKRIFFLLVSQFLLCQYSFCQDGPADCRSLLDNIGKKLDNRIKAVAASGKIADTDLEQLDAWFTELKGIVDKNSFGLFTGTGSASQVCATGFDDILKNFFRSNKQYLFQPAKCPTLDESTGGYADELNTPETMGRLKTLSFILHAVYPLCNYNTLNVTEKKSYTAFTDFLYHDMNPDDLGIYAFFYSHTDDIKKATGFDPRPGTQESKTFAQNFIRSFRSHLQYYFGVAEEEFARVDAADIRSGGVSAGFYRQSLHGEMLKGLRLIASELSKLKDICGEVSTDPLTGFTSRVTNYRPSVKTAKVPEKPTGEAGKLKPGNGWVLLGILDANGSVYKEYNDNPLVQLFIDEISKKGYKQTITSSKYQQVPAGRYFAEISMAGKPQSGIVVNNGAETHVALRLGRLVLDPRNFDGTAGSQEIDVFAIVEGSQTTEGAILTSITVTNLAKGGDSLNLAPGRYIVRTHYGIKQLDTVTIRSQQCTRLTITGAAKFTAPQGEVDIRRIILNSSTPQWIALLKNGQDIQLPPGLYEIKLHNSNQKPKRLNMQSGQAYTY